MTGAQASESRGPIELRDERPGDEPFVRDLYACTRTEELAQAPWSEEQKSAFLRMQFELQRAHYRRYYPGAAFQLILTDGLPIGRIYVNRGPDEYLLLDITVIAGYRGQGIGGELLRQLLAEAGAAGKSVTLHVEPFNRAQHLYRRLGFQPVEETATWIRMEWKPS